jgi:hypothetical protein
VTVSPLALLPFAKKTQLLPAPVITAPVKAVENGELNVMDATPPLVTPVPTLICIEVSAVFRMFAPSLRSVRERRPVATLVIAFIALKNWRRQDKAKREAEF